MKKLVVVLLLIGIIAGLFISSSQTYEQQTIVPKLQQLLPGQPLEQPLSKLQIPYWGKTISVEERGYYYFVEFLARKSAHFFTFGALAAVFFWLLPKIRFRFFIAAFMTFLAASADEFHQSLTGGRTATWQDVALDMSGALVFLIIVQLFVSFRSNSRKSRTMG
ncbi:VanZ family protein [Sporosarcina gallistercoris]|uniref:VanZ family protein n=1 Tax=Sporosarcina gallistercoris TaxID=2762245 RepID=A0ABR8PMM7_9BACL|nr:VanZ family protein [Sporosarcina gallistercoris]MBD7909404.1 VanZ family protein [Sporosarcina gallistercoris]